MILLYLKRFRTVDLKEQEIIELSRNSGYPAVKAEILKLEASGREYFRIYLDSNKTLVVCYLDPEVGNHSKFLHVATYFKNLALILQRLFFLMPVKVLLSNKI